MSEENENNISNVPENNAGDSSEKPRINPESEAVSVNRPEASSKTEVATQKTVGKTPQKIGKEVKKTSKKNLLLWLFGGLVLIFVLFLSLMVLVISKAGAENPIMQSFGVDAAAIKQFLLLVVSFSFGLLSIFFFILFIVGLFKWASNKKGDKEGWGKAMKLTLVGLIPLILLVFLWYVLYTFIGRIELPSERVVAEIVVLEPDSLESLTAPVEITFSSENVVKALQNSGYNIQGIEWDFDGDGEFEYVPDDFLVSRLYNNKGIYNIALRAILQNEDPRVYNLSFRIEDAVFGAEPSKGPAPLTVQFDASDLIPKGFKVDSLDWDFDNDGTYELTGKDNLRPRHTFEKIGLYNVHLRIVDQDSNVNNYYREIETIPNDTPLLTADINVTPDLKGEAPFMVRFDAGASESVKGKIIRYEWDFGDGSDLQEGKNVSYVFQEPGIYNVQLTVQEDSGKTAETVVQVEVVPESSAPTAIISTDPLPEEGEVQLKGILPFKVVFDASASQDKDDDIVSYEWNFDGQEPIDKEGKKVTQIFSEAGIYTVTLRVTDATEQSNETTLKVIVEEPGVKAVIDADPEEGAAPLDVQFDGSSSSTYEGKIVSYEWDFGDGSPKSITGANISHRYTAVGNYEVKLKVMTNQSESAEITKTIYVREVPLRACYTPSRRSGKAPLSVTFDPKCSTGAVSKYKWDFGDSNQSGSRKPSYTFQYPGNYTVTLEVVDDKNNVSKYTDVIVAEGEVE